MLRHFTIVSSALVYATNVATFEFPRRTKGHSRCAVIGWDLRATNRAFALGNVVNYFQIGARQYVQNDPVVFGLFTPTAPGVGNDISLGRPYFPGSSIMLPDGTSCGGMLVLPGERIEMRLTDLTAGSAQIAQVILHCVEFPADCDNATEQRSADSAWERLRQGVGETLLYGNALAYSASGIATLEALPKGPNAQAYRRKEVRGANYDAAGALQEDDFALLLLEVYSQTQRPTSNAGVPARSVAGHGALSIVGALSVDLRNDERAYIRVTHPTPGAARTARFVTVYEGREPSGPFLNASAAIS